MAAPWGTLTYINKNADPVQIRNRKFVIGRASDCDLSVSGKMVSSHHCYLEMEEDGRVYLWDTSANGTLVNKLTRLTNSQKMTIKTGDEICVAFSKNKQNLTFVFNNLSQPKDDTATNLVEQRTELVTRSSDEAKARDDKGAGESGKTRIEESNAKLPTAEKLGDDGSDEIEEHLLCSICQEIFHKCISLLPCNHCFCGGCYSEWMIMSKECPQCRVIVQRITPNYIINNLVEVFLKHHPSKRRDEEDLRQLDEKNQITENVLYSKGIKGHRDKEPDDMYAHFDAYFNMSDEEISSQGDSDSDGFFSPPVFIPPRLRRNQSLHKICRQCPDDSKKPPAKKRKKENYEDNVSEDMPSCSNGGPNKKQPLDYCCTRRTRHMHCHCCFEYMPDRTSERARNPAIPPQNCVLCSNFGVISTYCHMYWGCKGPNCTGCLAPLRDVNFDDNCLSHILNNGNSYESAVLVNYVRDKGLTWKDVLLKSLEKLDDGSYTIDVLKLKVACALPLPGVANPTLGTSAPASSTTPVCKMCAYQCLAQLAFQYRRDIPKEELPAEVTTREDCYWGRNCRTQLKMHHAKNFNHICEQTRNRYQ